MIRPAAIALALLTPLAACQTGADQAVPLPEAADPRLPAEVLAALPDDVSPAEVRRTDAGCWTYDLAGLAVPVTRGGVPICS